MERSADLELLGQLDVGEPAKPLLADAPDDATHPRHPTGILPAQTIRALIRDKHIQSIHEIGEDQIQYYQYRKFLLPVVDLRIIGRSRY